MKLQAIPESANIHCLGIGGVGMAGVAYILQQTGYHISGCDSQPGQLCKWLADNNITISAGHSPEHIDSSVNAVIYSAAIDRNSPELQQARQKRIPTFSRGEILPQILENQFSIAVSGTHGKTTTSSFIVQLLKYANKEPAWCVGGTMRNTPGVAEYTESGIMVAEADESDGSIAGYYTDISVITNIEFDHMEHFANRNEFEACFHKFIAQTKQAVIFCAEDKRATAICTGLKKAVSYGFSQQADIYAENIEEYQSGFRFALVINDIKYNNIITPVPGRHNLLNLLGAISAIYKAGINIKDVIPGIKYIALPNRRFEFIDNNHDLRIISDYAHHPTEIKALLQMTARLPANRKIAVFQPHRYSRTKALGADFPPSFAGIDTVILLPVYPASEKPFPGGMISDLYEHFIKHNDQNQKVIIADSFEQVWQFIKYYCKQDDLIFLIGAGDIIEIAKMAENDQSPMENPTLPEQKLTATNIRFNAPLAGKTTIKVGGTADIWAEIGNIDDLLFLQQWTRKNNIPFTVIGAGSNIIISDLGIRGVTARLVGDFKMIREENDTLIVGSGVSSALLLTWLEKIGATGLEFLEAIPAFVGGMLKMNAGAYGDEILNHILWIRYLKNNGTMCTVHKNNLEYGYRSCPELKNKIILEAGFSLEFGDMAASRAKRTEYAQKRQWMRGIRSCGSVFKNPPEDYAGKLIEEAGLKGKSIGGAEVFARHANFIVTDNSATASDVKALIEHIRAKVREINGIDLHREVKYL